MGGIKMKYIVKAFDSDGKEHGFLSTGMEEEGNEVSFDNKKAAEAFIEGIKISLPSTFQYKIIPEPRP